MLQRHLPRGRFLRDIIVSFVLAGKDSTSSALTWFFWLLAANPRCERRKYEEVASLSLHGHGDGDNGGGYDELRGMHYQYLHAAITEAMRLYPPVPINSRMVAAGDILPDGTTVRAGWFSDAAHLPLQWPPSPTPPGRLPLRRAH